MNNKTRFLGCALSLAVLGGCAASGDRHQANVYRADQVNQKQAAKTVQILAVMPARIEVDNTEAKKTAQFAGALVGALAGAAIGDRASHNTGVATAGGAIGGGIVGAGAGSLVSDKVLVDGVSLTYVEGDQTLNSAQVGLACEFQPGMAIVISTGENETRIQPNAACPPAKG